MSAAEWTDEKHSMYLKSMETSFVDQLYDSKEILDCLSSRIKNASSDTIIASGQVSLLALRLKYIFFIWFIIVNTFLIVK